jgi:unsaturated chondroitin disaccharide hydrolase
MQELKKKWKQPYTAQEGVFDAALEYCAGKTKENIKTLAYVCPSETAPGGHYNIIENIAWTTGFWPGILWSAYGALDDEVFLHAGKLQTDLFRQRLESDNVLQHHDIGFLYTLSTLADYKLTGSKKACDLSIRAAKRLMKLYRPVPGIIQRGGVMEDLTDKFTGVFIVDCMLNVPLLFWASEQTGDKSFYNAAYNHMKNSVNTIIQPSGAIIQHGIADVVKGTIVADSSQSQGKGGDDAAWSRGQAWAVYGLPIAYSYTGDKIFLESAKKVSIFFLNNLPSDDIANWDLYYTEDDVQRDTSASSIAVCGLLELSELLDEGDPYKEIFYSAAVRILESLAKTYMTKPEEDTMGLLNAGVYQMNSGKGVDQPTIWGDYYYMEALWRMQNNFKRFW